MHSPAMAQAATLLISSTLSLERVLAIRSARNGRRASICAALFTKQILPLAVSAFLFALIRLFSAMRGLRAQSIVYCVCMIIHFDGGVVNLSRCEGSWFEGLGFKRVAVCRRNRLIGLVFQ